MRRWPVLSVVALALGAVTAVAVAWGFAAWGRTGPSGQSVYTAADRVVPFGRSEAWGETRLYWRAMANNGGAKWGSEDDLYVLPSWSAARTRGGPLGSYDDYPKMSQTFEVATGWPFRALRAEFRDTPQGTPWPPGGPYTTVSGFGLSTVRTKGALLARALPYEPIWPGLLGDTAIFSAYWLALLAGIPAARRVLRAARGRCVSCGYELAGLPEGAVCPECGAAITDARRAGRWWPLVPIAATALIASAAAAPACAWAESRGFSLERIKPLWILQREASGVGGSAALAEINRRIEAKRVSAAAVKSLVGDALAAQTDGSRPWRYRWGDLVEAAHAVGLVDAEQWRAYARQAVRFTLIPRARVRVGDYVPLRLVEEDRVGRGYALGMEAGADPPVLDGAAGDIRSSPRVGVAPDPRPRIARYQSPQLYPYDPAQRGSGWPILPPSPSSHPMSAYEITWPRAARTGVSEVSIDLDVSVFENAYAGAPTVFPPRPASKTPVLGYKITSRAPVQIVDASVETVRLVRPESAKTAVEGIASIDKSTATSWAGPHRLQPNGRLIEGTGALSIPNAPVALAFDVIWRRGDREWVIDRFVRPANSRSTIRGYRGVVEGLDAGPVSVILRPSLDAARADPEAEEIWGGEVVLPTVAVEGPAAPERTPN